MADCCPNCVGIDASDADDGRIPRTGPDSATPPEIPKPLAAAAAAAGDADVTDVGDVAGVAEAAGCDAGSVDGETETDDATDTGVPLIPVKIVGFTSTSLPPPIFKIPS